MTNKLILIALLAITACTASSENAAEANDSTSIANEFGDPSLAIPDSLHRSIVSITHHYTGLLGEKYKLGMNLTFEKENNYGLYRYATQKEYINLRPSFGTDNKFTLEESTYTEKDGRQITGTFEGEKTGNDLKGTWFNKNRSKNFPFTLTADTKPFGVWTFADNAKEDEGFFVMNTIYVFDAQGQLHQTLSDFESRSALENSVELEDLNFDGHLDLRVLEGSGLVNSPYIYWLFDPQQNLFVHNQELAQVTSPRVDILNKEIVSDWKGSAALYGTDHYIYNNGHYTLASREERNYEEEEEEEEEEGGEAEAKDFPFTDEGGVGYQQEVNVLVCTLDELSPGYCANYIFSCGDFGVAKTELQDDAEKLWMDLTIDGDDGAEINPKYQGKKFEITYKPTEDWLCQPPGSPDTEGMTKRTVPLITGFRLVE
jgi:hypothetical protein